MVIFGRPAPAPFAALANGTLAHCLDFDDTHMPSITHTSAPVWAAALAAGEAAGADETTILGAYLTGFETATRAGHGLGQAVTSRGLHSTCVWGRLGAAAAGSAIAGLDGERACHALALAATQAGGLVASFGTMAKLFHAGKAAMDGLLAAQLAASGFTGNPGVLEPGGGFDRVLIQDGSLQLPIADGSAWQIAQNSFKPYAACHLVHPAVDAARNSGLAPHQVRSVRATVSPLCMQVTGNTDGRPTAPLAAKFDLKYCLAMAFAGRTLSAADFMHPWTRDDALARLAQRIAPEADGRLGVAAARLSIETSEGRTLDVDVPVGKGHPGNPMSWDDMAAKMNGLVGPVLGLEAAAELLSLARAFGDGRSLARLRRILAA
jgi:2-methylcitrate dehydratase PrpD